MLGSPEERLLRRLLDEPEHECIEFKLSWFDPRGIGRYASALSNAARLAGRKAGYLVWGVDDEGNFKGTKLDLRTKVVEGQPFQFWLRGRLAPRDHAVRVLHVTSDDKPAIILESAAAQSVPVRFESIPYVRVGSATPPLQEHPDLEARLIAALTSREFEGDAAVEHVTAAEVADLLDVDTALALIGVVSPSEKGERLKRLESLRVLKSNGGDDHWTITNLGAILFGRRLADFGPSYERKVPRVVFYKGDSRIETDFEQTGTRGYAIAFEGINDFIARQLPRREVIRGVRRHEAPVYPDLALRELIANALIHQDMAVRGAGPLVEVFDGRIEISNPGTPLVSVDRLMDEPPRSRNERLARLMRMIGYCEERGSGIDKVVFVAEAAQLPPPDFRVNEQSFGATLYGPREFSNMSTEERLRACYQHACLMWVTGRTAITNASLRQRFGLTPNRAASLSRLFGEALEREIIKPADPTNASRAQAAYVPWWA